MSDEILFEKPPDYLKEIFLTILSNKVGGDVVLPLYSHFGDSLFLVLSLLEGSYCRFPSLKALQSIKGASMVYYLVNKSFSSGADEEEAFSVASSYVGLPASKIKQIYKRSLRLLSNDKI